MNHLILQLMKETGGNCIYCGHPLTPETLTIDHIIPRARGGVNEEFNKVVACEECNRRKDSLTIPFYVKTMKMKQYSAFENRVKTLYQQRLLPEMKRDLLMDRELDCKTSTWTFTVFKNQFKIMVIRRWKFGDQGR